MRRQSVERQKCQTVAQHEVLCWLRVFDASLAHRLDRSVLMALTMAAGADGCGSCRVLTRGYDTNMNTKDTSPGFETDDITKSERDLQVVRKRVKERLRVLGKSQRDLEMCANFSTGYVSKLLSGDRTLKAFAIRAIAASLDKLDPAGVFRGTSTEEYLVEGTFYAAVVQAGDDAPTDVLFASLVEQLDEQRARVGELEAAKAAADDRARAAEQQVAKLEEKLAAAEKCAADAGIERQHESERVARAVATLEREQRLRADAEQMTARLRSKVELPQPTTVAEKEYMQVLRQHGVTDFMSYARLLERQKNEQLASERGKPGWGTTAVAFLAGVGAAVIVVNGDEKPKGRA
jgi:hypothetical protein